MKKRDSFFFCAKKVFIIIEDKRIGQLWLFLLTIDRFKWGFIAFDVKIVRHF